MVETELTSASEIRHIIDDYKTKNADLLKSRDITGQHVGNLAATGVMGSAAIYSRTGFLINPKDLISDSMLIFSAVDILSGKGMSNHKWTYTYFFYMSKDCDKKKCINDAYEKFFSSLIEHYKAYTKDNQNITVDSIEYSGAIPVFSFIEGDIDVTWKNKSQRLSVLSVREVDRISSTENYNIWGNESPRDYQDRINLPEIDYNETTELLAKASLVDPGIYIFRGLDLKSLKNQECSGGYFIHQGNYIPVPEAGCPPPALQKDTASLQ